MIDPQNPEIIYANACKFIDHIQYAREVGVPILVFDSECELYKIKDHYPEAKLLLRLVVEDATSQCSFSKKFGCDLNEVESLLKLSLESYAFKSSKFVCNFNLLSSVISSYISFIVF